MTRSSTVQTAPPLAVYVHWPFCKKKCPYCDFNSHVRDAVAHDDWREALLTELRNAGVEATEIGEVIPTQKPLIQVLH